MPIGATSRGVSRSAAVSGALRAFYQQPYGELWLGTIGFGFICYGVYCGINAVYKRIDP